MQRLVLCTLTVLASMLLFAVPTGSGGDGEIECNGTLTGPIPSNIVVRANATCTLTSADVDGNVRVEPDGRLGVNGGRIRGNLASDTARWIFVDCGPSGCRAGGTGAIIDGDVTIARTYERPFFDNWLCSTKIAGNLELLENEEPFIVGDQQPTPSTAPANQWCAPGEANRLVVGGNLKAQRNSHRLDVSDVRVLGYMQLFENVDTAGGTTQPPNPGGGGTYVFSNIIDGNLQCKDNFPIQGGLNAAEKKEGQCEAF